MTVLQQVAHYSFTPAPVVNPPPWATPRRWSRRRGDSGGSVVTGVALPAVAFASRRPGSVTVAGSGLITGLLNDSTFVGRDRIGRAGGTVNDSVRVQVAQVAQQVIISQVNPINKDAVHDTVNVTAGGAGQARTAGHRRSILFTSRNSTHPTRQTTTTASGATFALDRTGAVIIAAQLDVAKDSITVNVANVARSAIVTPDTLNFTTVNDTIPLTIRGAQQPRRHGAAGVDAGHLVVGGCHHRVGRRRRPRLGRRRVGTHAGDGGHQHRVARHLGDPESRTCRSRWT